MSETKFLPWLKVWTEMPGDTKIRQLDAIEKWVWVALLCMTRRSIKAPEIWTQDLDDKGRSIEDTNWRPATVNDVSKVAAVDVKYWLAEHEIKFQGAHREFFTKQEFLTYLAIEHFKKLDMVVENGRKVLKVINFSKRQFYELAISNSGDKKKQKSRGKKKQKTRKGAGSGVPKTEESQAVYMVWEHWVSVMSKPRAILTKQRRGKIEARLHEGYTVEDLKKAIDGCKASPFHMGENDRNTVYNDLELICRSGAKVEQFISRLQRQGGIRHVGGKPSNRYVAGKNQGAQADDPEAARRLEELKDLGRGKVPGVPPPSEAEGGEAGSGEGQGA